MLLGSYLHVSPVQFSCMEVMRNVSPVQLHGSEEKWWAKPTSSILTFCLSVYLSRKLGDSYITFSCPQENTFFHNISCSTCTEGAIATPNFKKHSFKRVSLIAWPPLNHFSLQKCPLVHHTTTPNHHHTRSQPPSLPHLRRWIVHHIRLFEPNFVLPLRNHVPSPSFRCLTSQTTPITNQCHIIKSLSWQKITL